MVPTLETDRLRLTPRTATDIEACVAMDSDLEVRRYITPDFRDRFDADAYRDTLEERVAIDAGRGFGWWIIRQRDAPERFHGLAMLIPVGLEGPEIEIGWRLPRASWGRGYATEAATGILAYAFDDLALSEVIACIDPENGRSIAVAARLGFVRAGRKAAYDTAFDLYRRRREDQWRCSGRHAAPGVRALDAGRSARMQKRERIVLQLRHHGVDHVAGAHQLRRRVSGRPARHRPHRAKRRMHQHDIAGRDPKRPRLADDLLRWNI